MRTRLLRSCLLLSCTMWLTDCTYMKFAARQGGYHLTQQVNPSQRNLKHMISRDTFFVYGRLLAETPPDADIPIAIAAFSDRYRRDEVVDLNRITKAGSYYGLNLPAGRYLLVALADLNHDGFFTHTESLGTRILNLDPAEKPDMVDGGVDINLAKAAIALKTQFKIKAPPGEAPRDSLYFPAGSIRSLDDPIFSPAMATLGMYEPAAFLEKAPMMFYALEENLGHKVPVIFVHGIGGSAAEFKTIAAQLDRTRYKPWFFHYPSGSDLNQLAAFFHKIFLSGRVVSSGSTPMVIVAHSMGGVVVREAFNLYKPSKRANSIGQIITLATPFGGHPAARSGVERAPVVLPSWYDLNPDSPFIADLFRKPLPGEVPHHLLYAIGEPHQRNPDKPGDGVVPLSSQQDPRAMGASQNQYAFPTSHTGILRDSAAVNRLLALITQTKSIYPPDHLAFLDQGGYQLPAQNNLSALEGYAINAYGRYLAALVRGDIKPFHQDQTHFLKAIRGETKPTNHFETAWLKYIRLEGTPTR